VSTAFRKLVAFRIAATRLPGILVSPRNFLKATAVARRQQRLIGIALDAEKNIARGTNIPNQRTTCS